MGSPCSTEFKTQSELIHGHWKANTGGTSCIFPPGSSLDSLQMVERCKKQPCTFCNQKLGSRFGCSFLTSARASHPTTTPKSPVLFTVQCGHQTKVYFVGLSSGLKLKYAEMCGTSTIEHQEMDSSWLKTKTLQTMTL